MRSLCLCLSALLVLAGDALCVAQEMTIRSPSIPALSIEMGTQAGLYKSVEPEQLIGPSMAFDALLSRAINAPCAGLTRDCSNVPLESHPSTGLFDRQQPFHEHDVCLKNCGKSFAEVDHCVSKCHSRLANSPGIPLPVGLCFDGLARFTAPNSVSCSDQILNLEKIGRYSWSTTTTVPLKAWAPPLTQGAEDFGRVLSEIESERAKQKTECLETHSPKGGHQWSTTKEPNASHWSPETRSKGSLKWSISPAVSSSSKQPPTSPQNALERSSSRAGSADENKK